MAGEIRQGDVTLVPRAPLTAAERATATVVPRDQNRVVLAYGEVTGHAHALHAGTVTLLELPDGRRVLDVAAMPVDAVSQALLVHEEHATLSAAPGQYDVVRQREYHPEAVVLVQD